MELLREIQQLLQTSDLRPEKVREATLSLREFEYIAFRSINLLRRMGLPEDVTIAIRRIQQLILVIRTLQSTAMFLSTGTPYGVALGLITYGAGLFQMYDMARGF